MVVDRWGEGASWTVESAPQVHEARVLRLDSSKARTLLGWRPGLNLEAAVDWTVGWYKAHARGSDMRDFTLSQIRRYEGLPA
jgi:CDP-glucose 4,6-dehydratase